tara:strand:+ start:1003 stop:1623 length:621 start_codon:yes stop_codon:yes gene_type:complete
VANEIELLVSIRRQGDSGVKRRGDVITCRLSGGSWGLQETKVHQIVTWPGNNASQEEIEASRLISLILSRKAEWGEPNPRVDFPFYEVVDEAKEDENGETISEIQRVITNRSILHFDFSALPEPQLNDILNENVVAQTLSADDLEVFIDERGIDKRVPSERGKKEHRDITEDNPVLHQETALRRDQTTNISEYISQTVEPINSWRT